MTANQHRFISAPSPRLPGRGAPPALLARRLRGHIDQSLAAHAPGSRVTHRHGSTYLWFCRDRSTMVEICAICCRLSKVKKASIIEKLDRCRRRYGRLACMRTPCDHVHWVSNCETMICVKIEVIELLESNLRTCIRRSGTYT